MPQLRARLTSALGSHYTIERELGGGGMSRIFRARDETLGRDVVIKVLAPELAEGLSAERFEREVRLAARLQHPHVVPVIAAGIAGGLPYYTMPFIDGESLRARLTSGVPLGLPVAVKVLADVARALDYAHRQGVVHRDIKPENVLLSDGIAVVTDFGIAKALRAAKTQAPGGTLTQIGTSLGTPAYMAPEQAAGDVVDARADLYAWGVMAYEVLAGAHPFAGKTTAQQLIAAQIAERPAPLASRAPGVPAPLAELVMRCLEKEPAARVSDASMLVAALESPQLRDVPGAAPRDAPHGARTSRPAPLRWMQRHRASTAASIVGVIAAAGMLLGWHRLAPLLYRHGAPPAATAARTSASAPAAITTVAVLPFVNTGGNAQDEYFSDGMTDELAHALSRLPSLRVAGRTSSYAFKGKEVPAQQIGRTLNVGGIVEGTVRRAGDRLRITAQLTSAADGLVVWSDAYESRATDVFQVQDQFTREIVSALEPALRGRTAATVADVSRGTTDPAAYDLYMKGRYFWAKRTPTGLTRAIGYFKQAIARDPTFARAHAGLAMAYVVLPYYMALNADSVLALAYSSATRALALDSTLADAHLALCAQDMGEGHSAEAERQCRAALAIAPNDPTAPQWHSENLAWLGQLPEAVAEAKRASALDPLSGVISGGVAEMLYLSRDFPSAIVAAHHTIALDSSFTPAYMTLSLAQLFVGRADSAVLAAEAAFRRDSTLPGVRGALVLAYAGAGRWSDAERVRAVIQRDRERRAPREGHAISFDQLAALTAFGISANDRAAMIRRIDWADMRTITFSACDPVFDQLKTDPAFAVAARNLGMGVCAETTPWPIKPRT
ncbi:MAG TPA: protein kinase [Gemmatimonadaceae bacterium]|nr:protein kinase [Gemmatimonadaceae bacterium]